MLYNSSSFNQRPATNTHMDSTRPRLAGDVILFIDITHYDVAKYQGDGQAWDACGFIRFKPLRPIGQPGNRPILY
jgi:hypothetical protein